MALCVITPIFYTKHIAVSLVKNPKHHKSSHPLLSLHDHQIRAHIFLLDDLLQNQRLNSIPDIYLGSLPDKNRYVEALRPKRCRRSAYLPFDTRRQ